MKLKEIGARSWRNIQAFAAALAYDEREDIEARVKQLEANDHFQLTRILALSDEVQALSKQVQTPPGWRS